MWDHPQAGFGQAWIPLHLGSEPHPTPPRAPLNTYSKKCKNEKKRLYSAQMANLLLIVAHISDQ